MLAPIVVVCWVAFTPEGFLSFPTDRWSLRWFEAIARYPEFVAAFWRSLWLGALSSAFAVAVSVPAALAIARYRFRGREAMTALFMSPLMIPHIVLGIAFLRFFTQIGLGGTFTGLVLSHIVIVLPFALRLTLASAVGLDRALEHAAVSLGASEWTVLKRVTLPLVVPGLASGWALAFINSFDEVTMTVFIAAPGTETLPVRMFLYIQDNIDPLVTSVSACVIAITVAGADRARSRLRPRAAARRTDRPWPVTSTTLPSSAAGWSAPRSPGAWRAKACRVAAARRGRSRGARLARQLRAGLGAEQRPRPRGLCRLDDPLVQRVGRLLRSPQAGDRPRCLLPAAGRVPSLPVGEGTRARANNLKRLHNQPGIVEYKTEMLDHGQVAKMLPDIGPEVVGGAIARSTAT